MWPSIATAIVLCALLAALYIGTGDRAKRLSHQKVVFLVSGSLVFGHLQFLGVLGAIGVIWPKSVQQMLDIADLALFKLELLKPGCMGDLEKEVLFAVRTSLVVVCLLFLFCLHFAAVLSHSCFRSKNGVGERAPLWSSIKHSFPRLVAAEGALLAAALTSSVATCTSPLVCHTHPNQQQRVRSHPSIMCWQGAQHNTMLMVGSVGMLIPLVFLAMCGWASWRLPQRAMNGDAAFLKAATFLFACVRPQAYWCSLAIILRRFLLALVPTLQDPLLQIAAAQLLLAASAAFAIHQRPYKVGLLNAVDVSTLGLQLVTLLLGAFFSPVDHAEFNGQLAAGLVIAACASALAAACVTFLVAVSRACVAQRRGFE